MIDEYLEKWLIKANNDLKVAENESHLTSQEMVTDAICFHSQQAVEKSRRNSHYLGVKRFPKNLCRGVFSQKYTVVDSGRL